jgi:hypothetical protein
VPAGTGPNESVVVAWNLTSRTRPRASLEKACLWAFR